MFLVTRFGERYEDHVPESFVTFSQLKQFFPFSLLSHFLFPALSSGI